MIMKQFINGPVVIDNTVLSNFSRTSSFNLIKDTLKGVPIITLSVKKEATFDEEIKTDVSSAVEDGWLKVDTLRGRQALLEYHKLSKKYQDIPSPKAKLGDGEAASLVYAHFNNCVLLTDDNGPRKRAKDFGVEVAGTLAILYFAQEEHKLITSEQSEELFQEMKQCGAYFPNRFTSFEKVIPEMEKKFKLNKII